MNTSLGNDAHLSQSVRNGPEYPCVSTSLRNGPGCFGAIPYLSEMD